MKKLLIFDGNAIIHRSYHALPPLTTKDGSVVNAVYGFATTLLKSIFDFKPTHIAVAFDVAGPTFRDELYEEYKAKRVKADQELYDQIPLVHNLVKAFEIKIFEVSEFEADDVIGTIAKSVQHENGQEIIIVTGDKDTLQLVDDKAGISVYAMKKGISDFVVYDEKAVAERYGGLKTEQIIDLKAIAGDTSDNIKGVHGIGEKGAIDLIKEFGSVEEIYKEVHKIAEGGKNRGIKQSVLQKLIDGEQDALLSKKLATIQCAVPIKFKMEDCKFNLEITEELIGFLKKLEFFSLVKRLEAMRPENAEKQNAENQSTQKPKPPAQKKKEKIFILEESGGWKEAAHILKKEDTLSIETKFDGEKPEGFLIYAEKDSASFLWLPFQNLSQKEQEELIAILSDKSIIGHDLKHFFKAARNCSHKEAKNLIKAGIENKKIFDIEIAAYLLTAGERNHDIKTLALQYLGINLPDSSAQGALFGFDPKIFIKELSLYAPLKNKLEGELEKINASGLFSQMEMPLVPILAQVEMNGVKVDKKKLNSLGRIVDDSIKRISRKIYNYAGEEFNISSSQQLREILYTKLGLDKIAKEIGIAGGTIKKGKTGLSTAASELEKMWEAHPIIPLISEYRELTKLKTTYIDVLPALPDKKTGRIHARFNQAVTSTGRLSSSDPNLQNIPVRTLLGREIRNAFISEKGWRLISVDYSQIELRIVASLAEDERMIDIFEKGEDIHLATAAAINNVPLGKVTKEMRNAAKEVNFGILYGMNAFGLSWRARIPRAAAADFIKKYFEEFHGVKEYIDRTIKFAGESGYVETLYGRRRGIPELKSGNSVLRNQGERMAVNMPIQGTAADMIKLAMVEIDKEFSKKFGEEKNETVKLILQVHDEVVAEAKDAYAEEAAEIIKKSMEKISKLRVPIETRVLIGQRWGDLK